MHPHVRAARENSQRRSLKGFAGLVFANSGAFMPVPRCEMGDETGHGEDADAGDGEDQKRGEDTGRVELELGIEDPVGEAGIATGGQNAESTTPRLSES